MALTWAKYELPVNTGWRALEFGNGIFVGISNTATFTSTDGATWVAHPQDFSKLHSMVFGDGIFLAVLQTYTAGTGSTNEGQSFVFETVSSTDGITWTTTSTFEFFGIFGSSPVAFLNGRFVLLLDTYSSTVYYGSFHYGPGDYTRKIATSFNGSGWTNQTFEVPSVGSSWYLSGRLAYGNGIYLWITGELSYTSPDLVNWTAHSPGGTGHNYNAVALYFIDGRFVAGVSTFNLDTSPDGVTWSYLASGQRNIISAGGDGVIVAMGANSNLSGTWAFRSDSLNSVAQDGPPGYSNYSRVVFGGGHFVAIDYNSTHAIVSGLSPMVPSPVYGETWVTLSMAEILSVLPPLRYLRMNQRDDGIGIERHPRLAGTGSNNPTSSQLGKPTRLGAGSNTYQ